MVFPGVQYPISMPLSKKHEVDMAAMKALVTLHGARPAAKLSGLPVGTVLSWARRYKWKRATLSKPVLSTSAPAGAELGKKDASDMLRESLENSRVNSTLHLARFTENASREAAKSKDPLDIARKVRDVAGVYQVLYPPVEEEGLIEGSILIGAAKVTDDVKEIEAHVRDA